MALVEYSIVSRAESNLLPRREERRETKSKRRVAK